MSAIQTRCYRIDYTDFQGRRVVRVWRAKAPCYIRSKALGQSNCRTLGPVTEITEEEFQRRAVSQTPAKRNLCNHRA